MRFGVESWVSWVSSQSKRFSTMSKQTTCRREGCPCRSQGVIIWSDDKAPAIHRWEGCFCESKQHEVGEKPDSLTTKLNECFRTWALASGASGTSSSNSGVTRKSCEWQGCRCAGAGTITGSAGEEIIGHYWTGCSCATKMHVTHLGTDACRRNVMACGRRKRERGNEDDDAGNVPGSPTRGTELSEEEKLVAKLIEAMPEPTRDIYKQSLNAARASTKVKLAVFSRAEIQRELEPWWAFSLFRGEEPPFTRFTTKAAYMAGQVDGTRVALQMHHD